MYELDESNYRNYHGRERKILYQRLYMRKRLGATPRDITQIPPSISDQILAPPKVTVDDKLAKIKKEIGRKRYQERMERYFSEIEPNLTEMLELITNAEIRKCVAECIREQALEMFENEDEESEDESSEGEEASSEEEGEASF